MKKYQGLSGKERAEYIALCILYPFLLLFGRMGKTMKLFGTRRRQITASVLTSAVILTTLPTDSITALASSLDDGQQSDVLTVQSAATGKTDFQRPKLGVGIKILPAIGASVYFGQYPQESSDANNKTPIKWLTTAKEKANDDAYNVACTSPNAITVMSEKVLDVSKWLDFGSKWTIFDDRWLVSYSQSLVNKWERTFPSNAFNALETAAITKAKITTFGGSVGPSYKGGSLTTESTEQLVYSPYYVQSGDSTSKYNDPVPGYDAEATAYAVSKGVKNEAYGASYWFRKPVVGGSNYEFYNFIYHIAKNGNRRTPTYEEFKNKTLGVRPITRVNGDNLVLVSQVNQKTNSTIVNENIAEGEALEYELTLLDSTRTFSATAGSQSIQGSNWVVPVTYANAKTGADEYISYTLTDADGNVLEYRRVKLSDAASGAFNVSIPMSALGGYTYHLNVFNEQIVPGVASDYASTPSKIEINIPRSPEILFQSNVAMQEKEGMVYSFFLRLASLEGMNKGQYKVYTDAACEVEFPMEKITLYGDDERLYFWPVDDNMPVGTYYVTYTADGMLPSACTEIKMIAYINRSIELNLYTDANTFYAKRTLVEGGDLSVFNVPKAGHELLKWTMIYDDGYGKQDIFYPGTFNLGILGDLAKTSAGGQTGINSFTGKLIATYMEVTAPVINSVSLSTTEGYANQVTATIDATFDKKVRTVEYSFDGGKTWQSSNKKVFTENTSNTAMVRYNDQNVSGKLAYSITNIDSTLPVITVSGDTDSWQPSTASLAVSAGVSGIAMVEVQKDGGSWVDITDTYSEGYPVTQNGSYVFRVTNGAGATETDTIVYSNIDTVKPALGLNSKGYEENTWKIDGAITIHLSNTANNPGETTYQYAKDGGKWTDCDAEFIIEEDCEGTAYTFRAISENGIVSDETTFIVKKDTVAPANVTVSYGTDSFKKFMNTISFGLFFKGTVTVTLSATDVTSGVKEFRYDIGDGEQAVTAIGGRAYFYIAPQFKGQISGIKAIDNAGNESDTSATEYFAVDSEKPAVPTVDAGGYTSNVWTKENVTFTVSGATADSGIAKYQYTTDGGVNWHDITAAEETDATATEPYNTIKTVLTVSSTAANGTSYKFRAVSNAGNKSAESGATVVKIDITQPVIVSVSGNPTDWTSSDVTLTVTASDQQSGLAASAYSFDNGETWQTGNTKVFSSNQAVNIKVRDAVGNISAANTVQIDRIDKIAPSVSVSGNPTNWTNGNVTLTVAAVDQQSGLAASAYSFDNGETWQTGNTKVFSSNQAVNIKVRDAVGNISAVNTVQIDRIDKTAPSVSVGINPTNWTNSDVTLTITAADQQSGLAADPYSFDDGATWQTGNAKVFGSNQEVNIKVRDAVGNISAVNTVQIDRIDKTAPTGDIKIGTNSIKKVLNTLTFGWFFKDTTDVIITAQDTSGEMVKIAYTLSETELTDVGSVTSWTVYQSKITLTPGHKYIIYAKLTDLSGNVTIVNSDGVVLFTNSTAGMASVGFTKTSTTDVTATVNLNGNTIKEVRIGGNDLVQNTDYTVSGGTITLKASYLNTLAAGDYSILVSFYPLGETGTPKQGSDTPASTSIALIVSKEVPSIAVIASPTGSQARPNSVILSANLPAGAAGTLQFKANGVNIGSPVSVGQTVSFASSGSVNDHIFTVDYSGDGNYSTATSDGLSYSFVKGDQSALSFAEGTPTEKTYGDTAFTVTATGGSGIGAVTYSVISGPAAISGNTVTLTGAGSVVLQATKLADNDYNEKSVQTTINVSKKPVTITGVTAQSKTYDGDTAAIVSGTAVVSGKVSGDTVSVSGGTATFSDKTVGSGKTVTFAGFYLSGTDADKYMLTAQPANVTADITAKSITATVIVQSKAYDELDAAVIASAALNGVVSGDMVNLASPYPTATFASVSAANNITVSFGSSFTLTGADAGNYTLTQPSATGNITNSYNPVKGKDYTVNQTGWSNTDFVITAETGFELSLTNTAGGVWSDSLTKSGKAATGSLTFYVRSKTTGAISLAASENYQIDKTAPTGDITIGESSIKKALNAITFGLFFKDTQRITITSADAGSSVASVAYKLSSRVLDENAVLEISDWMKYTDTFTLAPNTQTVVYVKMIDTAGNILYLGSDGLVLDGTAPVISGIKNGKTYCAAVTVTVTDANLDTVTVNGTAATLTDGKLTLSPTGIGQTVVATDKAGNSTTVTVTVYAGHAWDEGVVTVAPTTSKKGVKTYTSTHCGETKTEEIAILAPSVTEGQNSYWKPDVGGTLTFRSDAAFRDFISVLVDGKVIDAKYYELKEGSIIVTLKADYLATLPAGTHTIGIQSVTGTASTEFTVAAKADDKTPSKPGGIESPQTGDNSIRFLWIALLFVSGGVLTVFGVKSRTRKAVR
jgi:hypothetical protein